MFCITNNLKSFIYNPSHFSFIHLNTRMPMHTIPNGKVMPPNNINYTAAN